VSQVQKHKPEAIGHMTLTAWPSPTRRLYDELPFFDMHFENVQNSEIFPYNDLPARLKYLQVTVPFNFKRIRFVWAHPGF
jgi:hypothetical protein